MKSEVSVGVLNGFGTTAALTREVQTVEKIVEVPVVQEVQKATGNAKLGKL